MYAERDGHTDAHDIRQMHQEREELIGAIKDERKLLRQLEKDKRDLEDAVTRLKRQTKVLR